VAAAARREFDGAKREIVEHNLRLIVWVVRRFFPSMVTPDRLADSYHHGVFGLIRAAEKFDRDAGFKYSTYASWWIRQAISRLDREMAQTIHIPEHALRYQSAVKEYMGEHRGGHNGRSPSLGQLARHCGLPEEELRRLWQTLMGSKVSLDAPFKGEDEDRRADFIEGRETPPFDRVWTAEQRQAIVEAFRALDPREAAIVSLRFGLGIERDVRGRFWFNPDEYGRTRTLDEVGHLLGITRERVRQMETCALQMLRERDNPFLAELGTVQRDMFGAAPRANGLPEGYWRHPDQGDPHLGRSLSDLGLEARLARDLAKESIFTLGDLTRTSREELLQIRHFAKTSLTRIEEVMRREGEHLAGGPMGDFSAR
jgi:RNA polymerase sigma factor (sigma-70 family)